MDIVLITTVIASLFLLIGAAEPLASYLRLPYAVIIACLGILIGVAASFFLYTDLTDALNPVAEAILALPIRSNVFLYVFLPTLVFQVTLGLNLRRMADDWVPILVLAVVAVFVATFVVGYSLALVSTLTLSAALLVGAIVSTTDPSAVVSIFRSISAPRRLARIIEGESLLNDAAAIALAALFLEYVRAGAPDPSVGDALARFPVLLVGGVITGWIAARIAIWIMSLFARYELAVISVSIALPYLAYIVAEQSVGASGVIAVVIAAMTLQLTGPRRLPPPTWTNLREVWDLLAHWAGALIFILAALLVPRMLQSVQLRDLGLILVVVIAAIAARALILYLLLPLLTRLRLSPVVERPYRVAILWGGLRGAVTLSLALAVTESALVPVEIKRQVAILATGFTLFTLLVQGTTLRWVIGWLGLDKLSPLDNALYNQVIAVALQTVRADLARATESYDLTKETIRSEAKRFGERLDAVVKTADDATDIPDRDRITLGLIALASAERDVIVDRFRDRTISSALSERLLSDADALIEASRFNGRNGYNAAARRSLGFGRWLRLAVFLHNRLRFSKPLAHITATRFGLLLSQRLILRDLHGFIDGRIRRIHGRRVAELLHAMLDRRIEMVEQALEGLRLQFPGYAEEMERRIIRRTALRLEEREYDTLLEDGLIGEEVHSALTLDIGARRDRAEAAPLLDLALQKIELVRQFPLFSELDEPVLARLSRALKTRYVNVGETILRRETPARRVYFVASGAVELKAANQTWRLGRGEMFGQMGLLMRRPQRVEVTAIAPTTLLVLDEDRFLRLFKRSKVLQAAVLESARKRGIPAEQFSLKVATASERPAAAQDADAAS
ncbi:cation:proton antiporter [Roseovarius sp. SCSIO 43702]|uniref:cation:proton antiporter n=1 Tax=Roseovarius sp. SCSIO 43702 TaxID=2823043 RepID=UPI001C7345C0|nr:cation:proton antiporter [Roseovarius sp. SCSIO 43702]QYX57161.1 cation:proton antiporter [Roseovarius sp. SCSIO 43702]